MRQRMLLLTLALVLVGLVAPSASQAATETLALKAKVTRFEAHGQTLTAVGQITGSLGSNGKVTRDTAPVRFRVARTGRSRCDILMLHLAPLDLELLGAQVQTSTINLELYGTKGAILGNLFCALSRAQVRLPRIAAAMNRQLHGRSLPVMSAVTSSRVVASQAQAQQQSCQVLKLVLGPLHLNLLGLNVDLYGQTRNDPVVVTITAHPDQGILGSLLCSLAGGGGITSLSALQSLLQTLGLTVSSTDLQNTLNNLGIGSLANGLTAAQLQQILQALGQ